MERMGHDASQPVTSAVRGTKPGAELRRELQILTVDVLLIPVHIIDGRFFILLLVSPMTRRGQRSGNRQLQKARPSEPGRYICVGSSVKYCNMDGTSIFEYPEVIHGMGLAAQQVLVPL
jgi:hypothetical protein